MLNTCLNALTPPHDINEKVDTH